MSRTIRRKGAFYRNRCNKENGQWVVWYGSGSVRDQVEKDRVDDQEISKYCWHYDVPEGTKSFEMAKHEYHRDQQGYGYSIPSDFINQYATRPNRAKNRVNCRKLTIDPDLWDDMDTGQTRKAKGVAWAWY